jgi:hypothetical protein
MLPIVLASLLLAPKPAIAASVLHARVRPLSDIARTIVDDAARRSPTIAQLVFDLQQLDAIVYVEVGWDGRKRGATTIMPTASGVRMVRVLIAARLDPARRMEVLGHELAHALELARAPWVRDAVSFRALYQQIGFAISETDFETTAAREVERRVRGELAASRK